MRFSYGYNERNKLKPKNCKLFASETNYSGRVIYENGFAVSPQKIAAILEWLFPENATDFCLKTANYYLRFAHGFAKIVAPLHRLTDKYAKWHRTEKHQSAFEHLKSALNGAPLLTFSKKNVSYILDTDASLTGIVAMLSQVIEDKEKVFSYASKFLSKAEQNYCVTRRELLAVVYFMRKF